MQLLSILCQMLRSGFREAAFFLEPFGLMSIK